VGKVLNPITFTDEYEASHYSPTIKRQISVWWSPYPRRCQGP